MQLILGLISILFAEVVRDFYHIAGHYWQPIKQNHLLKKEVLYIGDEVRDVVAAHKAGVDIAAVGWGINDWKTLADEEPTHQVAKPDELLTVTCSCVNHVL